jgi:hypothetical protein
MTSVLLNHEEESRATLDCTSLGVSHFERPWPQCILQLMYSLSDVILFALRPFSMTQVVIFVRMVG